MTAIVMNTRTGAVTEYGASFAFAGITQTHAANSSGLYTLGGATDAGTAISATFRGPYMGVDSATAPGDVYVGIRGDEGANKGNVRVLSGGKSAVRGTEWQYALYAQTSGISRAKLGRGIRENFLAFGYVNTSGAAYTIRSMQVDINSSANRKAG